MQIKNLTITLKKDQRKIIDDLTFSINENEKIALIGEEGNGKSTILKALSNESENLEYANVKGEISKDESTIYVPQILNAADLEKSVEELLYDEESSEADVSEFYKILNQFELEIDDLTRMLKTFSGGERVKILISLAISRNPSLLILDEPTNDLDFKSIEALEKIVKNYNGKVIFASHDTRFIQNVANKIMHFELIENKTKSRVNISSNDYDTYVQNREEAIKTQTQRARNDEARMNEKEERWRKVHDKVERDLRAERNDHMGRLLKKTMHEVKAKEKIIEREKEFMTKMPEYEEQIFVNYNKERLIENGKCVLCLKLPELEIDGKVLSRDINLEVFGPKKIAIVGKNGAGKTTLLNEIRKNISPDLRVEYMPQNYEDGLNLYENAIMYLKSEHTKDEETKIRTYLASLKFTKDEVTQKTQNLSGGQKAKLFFVKMQLKNPEVLLLDEPTRNISPLSLPMITGEMKEFGGAIIFVSHDRYFIEEVADEIWELNENGLKRIYFE